jgi:hypothetical protein
MKKGDRVKMIEDIPYLNITRRMIGVVVGQSKYKIPKHKGSIKPKRGWDVEVKFSHKYCATIVQGEELIVVSKREIYNELFSW